MAVHISQEHMSGTSENPDSSDFSELIQTSVAGQSTVNPSVVYELHQSESLTFLYNLLYDETSTLTKTDILNILSSLKEREGSLPFAISELQPDMNVQGVPWGASLRRKFYQERSRVADRSWFTNVPNSRERALKSLRVLTYDTKTDFFAFHRFYGRLKNHITHFQLRSLVVCGKNVADGIFYPATYSHDDMLEPVHANGPDTPRDEFHSAFRLARLMPDERATRASTVKLDCLVDSRNLQHNCHSRVSSMACSDKFVVAGTFEGGFVMVDIADAGAPTLAGEVTLTHSADGITNDVSIRADSAQFTIASNDAALRYYDVAKAQQTAATHLPFAVNRLAASPHSPHEVFAVADSTHGYILDQRCLGLGSFAPSATLAGHTDYGFSCDWLPAAEHVLVSGNQDGTVRLWDRRMARASTHCWNSALGLHAFDIDGGVLGGPVRNCTFGHHGKHVVWAESLDHVGVLATADLAAHPDPVHARVQSIDFVGKCIGLSVGLAGAGQDEQLIIGVNDCPLGGILSYRLDAPGKPLPFDFQF